MINNSLSTPKALRLHIGIFGRVNVGKSSFLNMVTGQDVAIASSVPGTTTDVVEKAMELLPIGPVLFLDTAGLGDYSTLGKERVNKTLKIFDRSDVVVLIVEPNYWSDYEDFVISEAQEHNCNVIIVVNKIDLKQPTEEFISLLNNKGFSWMQISCKETLRDDIVNQFKLLLLQNLPNDFVRQPPLLADLIPAGGILVMVVPIDLQAPKGRLILPQVQSIRDALDSDAIAVVVKEREYLHLLDQLCKKPDLVICDSQVVMKTVADTPKDVKMTTFSILFSRYKGDLLEAVRAVKVLENITPGEKILIAEACSHHPIQDDIGRVKIPRWIRQFVGGDIKIEVCSGKDYPENLKDYSLIIHCGGCMLNRKLMLTRIQQAKQAGVPITNYGVTIAFLHGVLRRALSPFPAALELYLNK